MKDLKVLQEEISDCGVCSLLSIIRYYGGNANLEELRIDSKTSISGVTAYDLIECAKHNGFDATGLKVNKITSNLPCIAHLNVNLSLEHFVVAYKEVDDFLIIMDPANGIVKMKKKEFYKLFSGFVIELKPRYKLPKKCVNNKVNMMLKKEYGKQYLDIIVVCIINILVLCFSLLGSLYIKIYDYPRYILILSYFFIICLIIENCLVYKANTKMNKINNKSYISILKDFFSHILKLPLEYLHIKDPGEIVKRSDEISLIVSIYGSLINNILLNTTMLFPLIIIIGIINYKVLLILISLFSIEFLLSVLSSKNTEKNIKEELASNTLYTNTLIDYLYGLTSIIHSNTQTYIYPKISKLIEQKVDDEQKYFNKLAFVNSIRTCINNLFKLSINIYLVYQMINNKLSLSNYFIISFIVELILTTYNNIISLIPDYHLIKLFIHKVNDFYSYPVKVLESIHVDNYNLNIKDLNFSYNGIDKVLSNFSYKFKYGDKVILKGKSGCGKSTLCKLINKDYTSYEGLIEIGNKDISKYNVSKIISYSSQYEKIFTGTIRENILLNRTIDNNKLNLILDICDINLLLKERNSTLDTFLFGGGEELSGGERQLILLARALVSDFKVLILDETLSEINIEKETKIINKLLTHYKNQTIIYISHKNINIKGFKILYV